MRAPIAALVLIAPLAACGEGSAFDQAFRNSYREKSVQTCTGEARAQLARSNAAVPPGFDVDRLCGCAVDRVMRGKSARELMREPDEAAQDEAVEACIAEAVRGGGGAKPDGAKPGA